MTAAAADGRAVARFDAGGDRAAGERRRRAVDRSARPGERRRTIYSRASRLELNKLLAMFDYPDPNVHADRRVETTTPLQKMFVLNSPFMVEQAAALAERLADGSARYGAGRQRTSGSIWPTAAVRPAGDR